MFQNQERFLDLPAPGLAGAHQIDNAGVAVAAALELDLPEAAIAEGLKAVRWPARLQRNWPKPRLPLSPARIPGRSPSVLIRSSCSKMSRVRKSGSISPKTGARRTRPCRPSAARPTG